MQFSSLRQEALSAEAEAPSPPSGLPPPLARRRGFADWPRAGAVAQWRARPRGWRAEGGKMAASAAAGAASGLPGPVAQGLKEALVDTLTGILSPVQEVRAAAEEQIKVLEVTEGE